MGDIIEHNCGFFVAHTLHDVYSGLRAIENRGREGTGFAAIGEDRIDVLKFAGSTKRFGVEDLHYIFPAHKYHTYLGHVRYSTRGSKACALGEAHPHTVGGRVIDNGDHVLILDCDAALVHNGQVDDSEFEINRKKLTTKCDTEALLHLYLQVGEKEIMRRVPGAFTIAIADRKIKEVIVMRDRAGIKPGILGWKDGKYGAASEDAGYTAIGGRFVENLAPGEVYYFSSGGEFRREEVVASRLKHCFFEWNYIARLESVLNGASCDSVRTNLGIELAREHPIKDADIVTYTPRCPEKAAIAYAKETGLSLERLFYKLTAERSFQGPNSAERRESIARNLFLLPRIRGISTESFLSGKRVVLIDDSTIRGNNSLRARDLLRGAGVERIYLLNYTPRLCGYGKDGKPRGCEFGVDMPPVPAKGERYVARTAGRNSMADEINILLGMNVRFLSVEKMLKAFERAGVSRNNLCTFCVGGKRPF